MRAFGFEAFEKPAPQGGVVVEFGVLWRFVKGENDEFCVWKVYCRTAGQFIDWDCGSCDS